VARRRRHCGIEGQGRRGCAAAAGALHGSREISIEDIYRELLKTDEREEIGRWVDAELDAERIHGFVDEPILALIRRARTRGLRVFIVSDIYYSSAQLGRLLESAMGTDFSLIHRIHCSSEHGRSKVDGLWEPVLRRELLSPTQVFHLATILTRTTAARHASELPRGSSSTCPTGRRPWPMRVIRLPAS
jgi:predicted HAD superfamily hydrolase